MKAHLVIRGIAPLIMNLGARRRSVVSFTPRPFYPGKQPRCPLNRRLGGPQSWIGRFGSPSSNKSYYILHIFLMCIIIKVSIWAALVLFLLSKSFRLPCSNRWWRWFKDYEGKAAFSKKLFMPIFIYLCDNDASNWSKRQTDNSYCRLG
jgi:hypothetical protein